MHAGVAGTRFEVGLIGQAFLDAGSGLLVLLTPLPFVITANAAVAMNGVALLARFRHKERQAEEPDRQGVCESRDLAVRNGGCGGEPLVRLLGAGYCSFRVLPGLNQCSAAAAASPGSAGLAGCARTGSPRRDPAMVEQIGAAKAGDHEPDRRTDIAGSLEALRR